MQDPLYLKRSQPVAVLRGVEGGVRPPKPPGEGAGGGAVSGLVAGQAPADTMLCSCYLHAS